MRHPEDWVETPKDGRGAGKCEACDLQITYKQWNAGHLHNQLCRDLAARAAQHTAAAASMEALQQELTAYGEMLERVEVFKYLGRLLSYIDDDAQAVRNNLLKARRIWARISRVLRAENASSRVCGLFYKATVQAVLLYGSESWNITPSALKCLEGFHLRAARRMTGKMPKRDSSTGVWKYPETEGVLEMAGLHTIEHYIAVRRATIAKYIVDRPIFDMCREGERRRGSSHRQFWWQQPCNFDAARSPAEADADVVGSDDEEEF